MSEGLLAPSNNFSYFSSTNYTNTLYVLDEFITVNCSVLSPFNIYGDVGIYLTTLRVFEYLVIFLILIVIQLPRRIKQAVLECFLVFLSSTGVGFLSDMIIRTPYFAIDG